MSSSTILQAGAEGETETAVSRRHEVVVRHFKVRHTFFGPT